MFAPHVRKPQTKAAADSTTASRTSARRSWGDGTVEQAVLLQRSIDSQTASRPVANKSLSLPGNERGVNNDQAFDRVTLTSQETGRGLPFDFSTISVDPPGRVNRSQVQSSLSPPWLTGAIQTKLVVGEVNDPLEYEADRIADQVMRKPNSDLSISATPLRSRPNYTVGDKQAVKTSQPLRRESAKAGGGEFPGIVENVIRSSGRPLDPSVRGFMELRFGRDFSEVRVHDDRQSANAAQATCARAFTAGSHIVFAEPFVQSSDQGRRLLAHELAHVAQQSASGRASDPGRIQRQGVTTAPSPQQVPQAVLGLLQQTEEGRWALNVMGTRRVRLIVTKDGPLAFYNGNDNSCTLNTSLAPEVVASYFVHEMYHADRKATGKTGDPKKMLKEDYVKIMVEEEIQGTVRGYEATLELEKKGQLPVNAKFPPRFDFFRSAYNTGREMAQKANPAASEAELHQAGLKRAEAAIRYFVRERGLGPHAVAGGLGMTYAEYYSADWEKAHLTGGVTH